MVKKLFRKNSKQYCNKKCSNLILLMVLNICCLTMMSFSCLYIHKKSPYRQSVLIRNTIIDTIVYSSQNKHIKTTKQKNNIYKEKGKKLKSYEAHASYYHRGGKKTANGDNFQPYDKLTCAASPEFPFGTKLKVTNVANGKSVIVTVTDRGSFYKKRGSEYDLDLTYLAFSKISVHHYGRIKITYKIIN